MSNNTYKTTDSFTLDSETVALLKSIADANYEGNKSQTVRQAIRTLADSIGIVIPSPPMQKKSARKTAATTHASN